MVSLENIVSVENAVTLASLNPDLRGALMRPHVLLAPSSIRLEPIIDRWLIDNRAPYSLDGRVRVKDSSICELVNMPKELRRTVIIGVTALHQHTEAQATFGRNYMLASHKVATIPNSRFVLGAAHGAMNDRLQDKLDKGQHVTILGEYPATTAAICEAHDIDATVGYASRGSAEILPRLFADHDGIMIIAQTEDTVRDAGIVITRDNMDEVSVGFVYQPDGLD